MTDELREAIKKLHRVTTIQVYPYECYRGDCDCENECPVEPTAVCKHCSQINESLDDEAVFQPITAFPCPTRQLLGESAWLQNAQTEEAK